MPRQSTNLLHFVTLESPGEVRLRTMKPGCLTFCDLYQGTGESLCYGKGSLTVRSRLSWVKEILLDALDLAVPSNEGVEYRKDVTPVFDHAKENVSKFGFALRFTMPLGQHRGRHFNITAQLFRRVPAQKKPVEKSGLPLWNLEVQRDLRRNELDR